MAEEVVVGSVKAVLKAETGAFDASIQKSLQGLDKLGEQAAAANKHLDAFGAGLKASAGPLTSLEQNSQRVATALAGLGQRPAASIDALKTRIQVISNVSGDMANHVSAQLDKVEGAFQLLSGGAMHATATYIESKNKIVAANEVIQTSTLTTAEERQRASKLTEESLAAVDAKMKGAAGTQTQYTEGLRGINAVLGQAGVSTGVFGQVLSALTGPYGIAAAAATAFGAVLWAGVSAMQQNTAEVQNLMAVSGLSAEAADNLADTFQLLGQNTAAASTAMFRMAAEIQSGGDALRKIGVELRDLGGELKNEGELFLEVRNRLSEMGSATERNAALMDIFGRAGRSLATIMSMNAAEFAKYSARAGEISTWTQKMQDDTLEYGRAVAMLQLQLQSVALSIGAVVLPPLTRFLEKISEAIEKSKTPIEFLIRVTYGGETGDVAGGLVPKITSATQAIDAQTVGILKKYFGVWGDQAGEELAKRAAERYGGQFTSRVKEQLGDVEQELAAITAKTTAEPWRIAPDVLAARKATLDAELAYLQGTLAKETAMRQAAVAAGTMSAAAAAAAQSAGIERLRVVQRKLNDEAIVQAVQQGKTKEDLAVIAAANAAALMGLDAQQLGARAQINASMVQGVEIAKQVGRQYEDLFRPEWAQAAVSLARGFEDAAVQAAKLGDNKLASQIRAMIDPAVAQQARKSYDEFFKGVADGLASIGASVDPVTARVNQLMQAMTQKFGADAAEGFRAWAVSVAQAEAVTQRFVDAQKKLDESAAQLKKVEEAVGLTGDAAVLAAAGVEMFGKHWDALNPKMVASAQQLVNTRTRTDELTGSLSKLRQELELQEQINAAAAAQAKPLNDVYDAANAKLKAMANESKQLTDATGLVGEAALRAKVAWELYGENFNKHDATMQRAVDQGVEFRKGLEGLAQSADLTKGLADIGLRTAALGDSFDTMGARVTLARAEFERVAATARGVLTPAVLQAGQAVQDALADQRLYQRIESGFLSITDTFTQMAQGLIQGTLEIGQAFENLGQSLLVNFVQLVIHEVFDPILKEAAKFVTGLVKLLMGGSAGGSGGGWAGALLGLVGSLFAGGGGSGAFQGMDVNTYLYPQFGGQNFAQGAGQGSGGGLDVTGILGGLGTIYDLVASIAGWPTIMGAAKIGLTSLGQSIGLLGSTATTMTPQLATALAELGVVVGEVAGTATVGAAELATALAELGIVVGEVAGTATVAVVGSAELAASLAELGVVVAEVAGVAGAAGAGAAGAGAAGAGAAGQLVGPIAGLGFGAGSAMLAGVSLPAIILGLGTMFAAQSHMESRLREMQRQRRALGEVSNVQAQLGSLTLQNMFDEPHKRVVQSLFEFSAHIDAMGKLWERGGVIEGTFDPERGGPMISQEIAEGGRPQFWDEARRFMDIVSRLGFEPDTTRSEMTRGAKGEQGEGAYSLLRFSEHGNALLAAYVKRLEELTGGFTGAVKDSADAFETFIQVLEAEGMANSLNAVAEAVGVATQAVPDFVALIRGIPDALDAGGALEQQQSVLDAALATMKDAIVSAIVDEPLKALRLLDFSALQKEGEDLKSVVQRMATALSGLDGLMTSLSEEADVLRNGLGTVPEQLRRVRDAIAEEMTAMQQALESTVDPEVMLAAATRMRELILAEQRATVQAVEVLEARVQESAAAIIASSADMASQVKGYEDQITQIRTRGLQERAELEQQIQQTQDVALTRIRALEDARLAAVNAIADMADTLVEMGVSFAGATAGVATFLAGLTTVEQVLRVLPTFIRVAVVEIEQAFVVGLDAVTAAVAQRLVALGSAVGEAIALTFAGIQSIQDPREKLEALTTFAGQMTAFYKQTVASVHAWYQAARDQARALYDQRIEQIGLERTAAQDAHDARMEAFAAEREALSAQREAAQKTLETAREWARIAEGLSRDITGLKTGSQAPPNAQAQFAEALLAFQRAKPEDAGEAGRRLLDVALSTGLMTRPDPEYAALFKMVTDKLEALRADAAKKASPEEAALAALKAIDVRLEAIAAAEKAASKELEATLAALTAEEKSATAAFKAYIAQLDAEEKDVVAGIQAAFKPLFEAVGKETVLAIEAAKAQEKAIAAQAEADAAVFRGLLDVSANAEALQVGYLQQQIAASYEMGLANVSLLNAQWETAKAQLLEVTAGAGATERAAAALEDLSGRIHESLRVLVSDRIDDVMRGNSPEGIRDALGGTLGEVVAQLSSGLGAGGAIRYGIERLISQQDRSPAFQTGSAYTPAGLARLHEGEMVLPPDVASWAREHGLGGLSEGAVAAADASVPAVTNIHVTIPIDARGADPDQVTRAVQRALRESPYLRDALKRR